MDSSLGISPGYIGHSRPIPPLSGEIVQLLRDPVAPRFELASLWFESMAAEPVLSMDCQSGVMAVLSTAGSLQVIDTQHDTQLLQARVKNPHRTFVDPSGAYVLATATDGEVDLFSVNEGRLLSSFSLKKASTLLPFRSTVHVGESVCWMFPKGAGAKSGLLSSSSATARRGDDPNSSFSLLIGSQRGGLLFAVHVAVPPPGAASAGVKVAVTKMFQLPEFFTDSATHLPVSSVFLGMVSQGGAPPGATSRVLFVATPLQLYRAVVPPTTGLLSAEAVLSLLTTGAASLAIKTVSPPVDAPDSGLATCGALSVFRSHAESAPRSYAWSSAAGILHGLLGASPEPALSATEQRIFSEAAPDGADATSPWHSESMIALPKPHAKAHRDGEQGGGSSASAAAGLPAAGVAPSQVIITAFHMVAVYPQRCLVLNYPAGLLLLGPDGGPSDLDQALAQLRFDPFRDVKHMGPLRGAVRDAQERKVYLYSESHVWEMQADNEHRQQWRLFLAAAMQEGSPEQQLSHNARRRLFHAAYNLCRFNAVQRSVVQYLRGRFYLSAGATDRATSVLADCELVDLVLAALSNDDDVMASYLAKRFTYLARFQLAQSDEQRKQQREELVSFAVLAIGLTSPQPVGSSEDPPAAATLHAFLDRVVCDCGASIETEAQRTAVFDVLLGLLEEQGHAEAALHLAEKTGRHSYLVTHHLSSGGARRAIEVLARHTAGHPEMAAVWYRHARELVLGLPIAAVTALLKISSKDAHARRAPPTLDVERLLPVLADYRIAMNEDAKNKEHQIIILLEQCIHHFDCVSSAVHNCYISLLAEQGDVERLEEVISASLFFDPRRALRACLTHRCFPVCVQLYQRLGLYEDAVLTALLDSAPPPVDSGDSGKASPPPQPPLPRQLRKGAPVPWPGLTAAKELLRGLRPKLDEESYRRLWQIIAEFAIERSHDARLAMGVVDDSDGALQLADVLGSVDDSHVVQEFREAICASLDRYAGAIAQVHSRQEEAHKTAEDVKRELGELRDQYGYVTAKQCCPLCRRGLHSGQPMLVYASCQHVVHEACAVKLLESIGGLEAFLTDEGIPHYLLEGVGTIQDLAQVDCVLCGEAAIVTTDIPLCEESASWALV